MNRRKILIGCGGIFALLFICGTIFQFTSDRAITPTPSLAEANQPTAVSTPLSTDPTATAVEESPTATAVAESRATATSQPTAQPTIAPIILTGSGDSIVDVQKWDGMAIANITGNDTAQFFAVKAFDAAGSNTTLVNTTDPYSGTVPLDWGNRDNTVRFSVESSGDWQIELHPLTAATTLDVPGTLTGTGDTIIFLTGQTPDLITTTGNAGSNYFNVTGWAYGTSGKLFHSNNSLLVNTTDPYEGTAIVGNATALQIQATGEWTIEITAK